MKKFTKAVSIVLVLVMLISSLAACGGDSQQGGGNDQPASKDIVYGLSGTWGSLAPWSGLTTYSCMLQDLLFEPVAKATEFGLAMRAAESITTNEDNTVWDVKLREDIFWSDGVQSTADDWVWTMETVADPDFGIYDTSAYITGLIAGTDDAGVRVEGQEFGVKKLGDFEVEFTFKAGQNVDAYMSWYGYYFRALPKHAFDGVAVSDVASSSFWDAQISNGVAVFKEEPVKGQTIVFAANKDYFLGTPQWDNVTYTVVAPDNCANALMNGDVDTYFSLLDREALPTLESYPGLHVEYSKGFATYFEMSINNIRYSPRVRYALDMLIDKDAVVAVATSNYGYPIGDTVIGSEYTHVRDVEQAKKILEEEGFDFENTVISIACIQARQNWAAVIQQNWAEAGVKSEIKLGESATIFAQAISGDVDCCLMGNSLSYNPTVEEGILDPNGQSYCQIQDDRYVKLCYAIDAETDPTAKQALIDEYVQAVREDCPYIYLFALPDVFVSKEGLSNIRGQFDEPEKWVVNF
jgi:peptide/nickel transport system substrate-binding protein